jgi:hypothetical protein
MNKFTSTERQSQFTPPGDLPFIHIFHFKSYAFIMCKLHIVIGNIFIVLHILLTVSQYEFITVCSVGSHKFPLQLMIRGLVK